MDLTIVCAVQTCLACPSQWDAWNADGQYFYFRFRSGYGSAHAYASRDHRTWSLDSEPVAEFAYDDDGADGIIALGEFCEKAGLTLSPEFRAVSFSEYLSRSAEEAGLPRIEEGDG